jgi:hypothetical protein
MCVVCFLISDEKSLSRRSKSWGGNAPAEKPASLFIKSSDKVFKRKGIYFLIQIINYYSNLSINRFVSTYGFFDLISSP